MPRGKIIIRKLFDPLLIRRGDRYELTEQQARNEHAAHHYQHKFFLFNYFFTHKKFPLILLKSASAARIRQYPIKIL
jgi:hypothetical protein